MDIVEPERECLQFHVDPGELPAELASTVQTIKEMAEKVLFRWKKFPLRLPAPVFELPPALLGTDADGRKTHTTSLRDVFTAPNFEEADAVARDAKGRPPRLDQAQLRSIREHGEFEVGSRAFPGRTHRWRLSRAVQSGRVGAQRALLRDVALALRLLVVTARNRFDSHFLSLRSAWAALSRACFLLLDALVGLPSVSASLLTSRLQEERVKHLVAELTIEADTENQLEQLCLFVRYQIKKQTFEKCHLGEERLPTVPYVYRTPKGQLIDLRLYNTELLRCAMPFLAHVLERELRGWFPAFREALVAKLRAKKLTDSDIEKQAKVAVQDEYLRRVSDAVGRDAGLENLAPGLGQLLSEQAQAAVLIQRALDVVRDRTEHYVAQERDRLQEEFPVLSLIGPWMRSHLQAVQGQLEEEHCLEAHETALALCRERGLCQAAYFVARDLSFLREQAPALAAELARLRAPTRTFTWQTHVWRPSRWQVRRVGGPSSEGGLPGGGGDTLLLGERPTYVAEKQSTRLTSTRLPMWRWGNFCHRTWAHTCNAMFLLGILIPWCSPLSLRSLVLPRPFMPDFEVNQEDGRLQPRKSSATQTLCSRLNRLWRHISKSRTDFEAQPDSGFVGKGLSRHLNRIWNYVFKGLVGTVLLVLLFPIVSLVVCLASLVAALLAPLWMPCVMLVFHLVMVLAYDFDSPAPERNRICVLGEAILWQGLVLGLLQPVAAALVALILCPIAAGCIVLVALLRWVGVRCWDALLFHSVVKRRARVPLGDSWMVTRVAGPGLSQDHLFQVNPEQALAAFLAKVESEQLLIYGQQTEKQILEPLKAYERFVEQCFGPFAATLARDRGPYRDLEAELSNMVSALKAEVDKRRRELQLGLGVGARQRTRMSATGGGLQVALAAGAGLAQQLLPRLPSAYWHERTLEEKDWLGLAAQLYSEVFSPEFLVPLLEDDVAFPLQAVDVDLSRYKELSQMHSSVDLDVSRVIHLPKGKIHVHTPYLDLSAFNPQSSAATRTTASRTKRPPWKRKRENDSERPSLPPAVPHPAKIALIIFNRENEDPIPLDSEACLQVLKAVCSGSNNAEPIGSSGASSSTPSVSLQVTPSAEDVSLEPQGQRATYTHSGQAYSTCV